MKTILVPTDFSNGAFHAAMYATDLASEFQATVHLLNVFHIPNPLQTLPVEIIITPTDLYSNSEKKFQQLLHSLRKDRTPPVKFVTEIRNGFSEKEILDYARFIHADLIVMGISGSGKITGKIFGRTASSIVSHSTIPVLLIPESVNFSKPLVLAFAIDGKHFPEWLSFKLFFDLVEKFKSEISIVTVLPPSGFHDENEIINRVKGPFLDRRHSYHFLKTNNINDGIREFIQQQKADILVMISHEHSILEHLLRKDHVKSQVFHSQIPLFVIPGFKEAEK